MILADTSAWVEFDRGSRSKVALRLRDLVRTKRQLAVTEPVMAEVLAGARDDARERQLRRLLQRFTLLPFDAPVHFEGAVSVYRSCRKVGITPRGLIDCMITSVAIDAGAEVLSYDRDLARIADVVPLRLCSESLR